MCDVCVIVSAGPPQVEREKARILSMFMLVPQAVVKRLVHQTERSVEAMRRAIENDGEEDTDEEVDEVRCPRRGL